MKKLLVLALMGSLSLTAFGQGQVVFNNFKSGVVDARITETVTSSTATMVDGSDPLFRAALIGGAVGETAASATSAGTLQMLANPNDSTVTWVGFRTGGAAGIVNVGSLSAREIPGVDWGGQAMVQIVAWYGDATSYGDALTAGDPVGFSDPLTVTLPSGPTSPDLTYLGGMQGFNIGGGGAVIPEPSTFALAGLGAAALLIFRRRK